MINSFFKFDDKNGGVLLIDGTADYPYWRQFFMPGWSQHIHPVYMDRDWQITASNQILNDIILVQVVNAGNTIWYRAPHQSVPCDSNGAQECLTGVINL